MHRKRIRQINLKSKSFTITELITVITVLLIVVSMIMPSLAQSFRRTRQVQCVNNLKQFGVAVAMYVDDHDGFLPPHNDNNFGSNWLRSMFVCRNYYANEFKILKCPDDVNYNSPPKNPNDPFPYDGNPYWSYCYNSRMSDQWPLLAPPLSVQIRSIDEPAETIIYLEGNENDGGVENDGGDGPVDNPSMEPYTRHNLGANYLFSDFHVGFEKAYSLTLSNFTPEAD